MAFVQAVVKLTTDLQFDGWLLNIENKLTLDQVNLMVMLLKNLKGLMMTFVWKYIFLHQNYSDLFHYFEKKSW